MFLNLSIEGAGDELSMTALQNTVEIKNFCDLASTA